MKHFFLRLAVLFTFVFTILILFDAVYRSTYKLEYPQLGPLWLNPSIEEKYELVKVGNSHAKDGITFARYNIRALDLTGAAQRFRFDRVQLQQHQNEIAENAVILIDVSHLSFSHRKADQSDGMQGNYYGRVSPFLIPDLKWSDYLQTQVVPFIRTGYVWRQRNAAAIRDRISAEEKWEDPSEQATSSAQTMPFRDTIAYYSNAAAIQYELDHPRKVPTERYVDNMNFVFNKWYHTDEFDPKYFEHNQQELEKLITFCLEHNWRPVLITIPITSILENGLLADYKQVYLYDNLAKVDTQGVEYIDFTTRPELTENASLYANADHFSERGALVFSYVLLQELIDRGYLSPEVDGYDATPLEELLPPKIQE